MALALGSFVLYSANLREISAQDTAPNRVLAYEVIRSGRLDLDRLFHGWPASAPIPYWVQRVGPHYVSSYPVAPALLAVPVYLVPILLGADDSWLWLNVLSKLAASLLAALSVVFVYLTARELARRLRTGELSAVAAAVVYAVATPTWAVSSQGLWGHAPAQLGLAVATWALLRPAPGPAALGLAGLATALAVACRPPAALVAAAIGAYAIRTRRLAAWPFLAAGGTLGIAVLASNVWTFGSAQGGYAWINRTHAQFHGVEGTWSAAGLPGGLAGLLLSPSRGLLVYSPVLLAAFLGLYGGVRRAREPFLHYLAAGVCGGILTLGIYRVWWGGHSFGPRLLVDVLPALVLGLVPIWPTLWRERRARWLFGAAFAVSVLVEVVGAFYYPSAREVDWNVAPRDVDFAHERLWDWRDSQLRRLLQNGPAKPGFRATP
jgi:hypothetical protein